MPTAPPGRLPEHVPDNLGKLFNEARVATASGAYTAAVLVSRKMLMNVAVEEGDKPGKNFIEYVEYLDAKGFIPPHGKSWVDYIRQRGNEANHEIRLMSADDAHALLRFIEKLLEDNYEFPNLVPQTPAQQSNP